MIDLKLIVNIFIALFLYNLILKAIGSFILNEFIKTDLIQKKSFREKLKDKLNEKKQI